MFVFSVHIVILHCLLYNSKLYNYEVRYTKIKIWTVDSFANKPFSGNPAAVTIVEEFPADAVCQKIAAEMALSETAFVKPMKDEFHIRWFTPAVEIALCGHATLAAAHILIEEKITDANSIQFASLSGILVANKIESSIVLDFPLQKTGPNIEIESLKNLFGDKIVHAEKAYDDLLIEFDSEHSVRNFKVNQAQISALDFRGVIITAKSEGQYDFVSRFFGSKCGVGEDPVTGSAHCKLADYWGRKFDKTKMFAYQASARGGEISIEIKGERVYLTGKAITILRGELAIEI
jgi:PhzF family phenazine biosynthesis protein